MLDGCCNLEGVNMKNIRLNKKPVFIGASIAIVCFIVLAHFGTFTTKSKDLALAYTIYLLKNLIKKNYYSYK